jgi:hypothetical protein
MHKRLFFVLTVAIMLLMALAVPGAAAQEKTQIAPWSIIVFNNDTRSLEVITSAGIQPGPTLPGTQNFTNMYNVRVSPDGVYALFFGVTSDTDPGAMYIANLSTGSCCVKMQDPAQPNLTVAFAGPFSPDGTQIVVSLLDMSFFTTNTPPYSALTVFDLASGGVVASIPMSALNPQDQWAAAAFGDWKADGIRAVPSCYGCEGVWEGLYNIWDPATGAISPPTEPFNVFMNDLPATGELIHMTANAAYPESGAPGGMLEASNVVEYYANNLQPTGQVIFFSANNPYVIGADWVYDGKAILVQLGGPAASLVDNPFTNQGLGEAYLLFRDGRLVPVQAGWGYVMTGTPEGWLSFQWETNTLNLVKTDDNGTLQITPLGSGSRWELASVNFTLGMSVFPTTTYPTILPPARTTCPGFMESRLWPNSFARVTPGDANNLRDQPSASGNMIGSIPGEEIFAVLEGPVCAENMAWWRVQYLGQMGWTPEGQGNVYWLDPLALVW